MRVEVYQNDAEPNNWDEEPTVRRRGERQGKDLVLPISCGRSNIKQVKEEIERTNSK